MTSAAASALVVDRPDKEYVAQETRRYRRRRAPAVARGSASPRTPVVRRLVVLLVFAVAVGRRGALERQSRCCFHR